MSVVYGMDHRIIDGATAARFNKKLKDELNIKRRVYASRAKQTI